MKVGSIGYATYQGLGLLLKDFYDNGVITDVFTVEHPNHFNHDWYKGPRTQLRSFDRDLLGKFVSEMDVMFFFETPFDPSIISYCRSIGVRTILMPMYECTPQLSRANHPDLILTPSKLDQKHYPEGEMVQVPIPNWVTWKERKTAEVFVHNAGRLGIDGRNGTKELLEAMKYVQSPIKLILRSQVSLDNVYESLEMVPDKRLYDDARVDVRLGTIPLDNLYDEGDVFIFPEKFNGLSLPLQEAKASGMAVMGTDRFPINTWTDKDMLIPFGATDRRRYFYLPVDYALVSPINIAHTIDKWYGKDISAHSQRGRNYLEANSWDKLKDTYMHMILSLKLGTKI